VDGDVCRTSPAEVAAGKSHAHRRPVSDVGAAWGVPIARVEVQLDRGPWQQATIDEGEDAGFAWKLWSLNWAKPATGEHTITSRAIDTEGQIQPAQDDPWIAWQAHLLG